MRHLRPFAAIALSAALATAPGLATAAPATAVTPATPATTVASTAAKPGPEEIRAKVQRLMPKAPTALKQKLDRMTDGPAANDGSQYQCGPTEVNRWVAQSLESWDEYDLLILQMMGALDLPTYDALVFGSENDPRYALREDRQVLTKTMKKLEKFWDVRTDDIELMAMHGDMLLDRSRTARVYEVVFGLPKADAQEMADLVATFVASKPHFQGGDHPIFTFNAFAFTTYGESEPGIGVIGDRIVMGDGILRAYRELGYGDVAPQAILAHEFGHHVQFELRMHGQENTPETTRRTELHADAASAYFLSHPRGTSMQIKRVTQFLRVFYTIGDCQFDSPGHHGTPNQRERAGNWAYQLQEKARPKGHILPAVEFTRLFDAALPGLVAPDVAKAA
ncbi:hypothetical protein [Mobilicoccus massiliensis]|uniref:hypothetical protein n=1 Tax=Mobilicoccus massiliensis TaxID=1522310 RepID=UPI0005912285|nr:hypothetical protein [Mobilicoccus massiliensis]